MIARSVYDPRKAFRLSAYPPHPVRLRRSDVCRFAAGDAISP
jgi:hypothetical protein